MDIHFNGQTNISFFENKRGNSTACVTNIDFARSFQEVMAARVYRKEKDLFVTTTFVDILRYVLIVQ